MTVHSRSRRSHTPTGTGPSLFAARRPSSDCLGQRWQPWRYGAGSGKLGLQICGLLLRAEDTIGLTIRTEREEHPGGWHGRHVLETPVRILPVVDPEQEADAT